MNLERYNELRNKVDSLQGESDRAKGALEQLMTRLKEEFGCSTLKEAKALLLRLDKEEKLSEKEYLLALKKFEERWKNISDNSEEN